MHRLVTGRSEQGINEVEIYLLLGVILDPVKFFNVFIRYLCNIFTQGCVNIGGCLMYTDIRNAAVIDNLPADFRDLCVTCYDEACDLLLPGRDAASAGVRRVRRRRWLAVSGTA